MRPTHDELLIGLKSILENVIAPQITDTWAVAMANQMGPILEHLQDRPERERAYIANQNAELRGLVKSAADHFDAHPELAVDRSQVKRLRGLQAASQQEGAIEALARENEALRDGLVWAIEALAAAGGHAPRELGTTKLGIRDGLKKMLEDDIAFWRPMGLGGRPQPRRA